MKLEKKKVVTMTLDENGVKGVRAISFVDFPAIEENFIALSDEKIKLSAQDEERRMVYGAVLVPDKLILRTDEKTGEPFYITFPSDTIRASAYAYMKQGNQHNHTFMHEFNVQGATVVESWIKEGENDKSVHLGMQLPLGTWLVGVKIDNDELWAEIKEGKVKGFSVEAVYDFFKEGQEEDIEEELKKLMDEIESML